MNFDKGFPATGKMCVCFCCGNEYTSFTCRDIQHMVFVLPVYIIIAALVLAVCIFVIYRRNKKNMFGKNQYRSNFIKK